MSATAETSAHVDIDAEAIRTELIAKVEKMDGRELEVFRKIVLQVEIERLAAQISENFRQAYAEGKFAPERVAEIVREFRARHPYR